MLKVKDIRVHGFEEAIRGMRNPYDSWDKSDTYRTEDGLEIGDNDIVLMQKLVAGGPVHAKFRRMITVTMDITAPLYWWKEFDTYKIGTVANSCSTMHTIAKKEFTFEDFSCEHLYGNPDDYSFTPAYIFSETIRMLNYMREKYLKDKDKETWWQLIQLLPSSYNQKRTVMLNYEVLANIYKSRKNHKLDEWHELLLYLRPIPLFDILIAEGDTFKDEWKNYWPDGRKPHETD